MKPPDTTSGSGAHLDALLPPRWRPGPRRSASGRSPWTPPRPSRWPSSPAPSSRARRGLCDHGAGPGRARHLGAPTRVLGGVAFSLGLVLVMVGGAEPSRGTISSSWRGRAVGCPRGRSCATGSSSSPGTSRPRAALPGSLGGTHRLGDGLFGVAALAIAAGKLQLGWAGGTAALVYLAGTPRRERRVWGDSARDRSR